MRRLTPIALVALALAGCGGSDTGGAGAAAAGAADLLPAATPVYAEIDSSLDSSEWDDLNAVLDRFPGRDRLTRAVQEALSEEGVTRAQVEAAFGDLLVVAVLDAAAAEETLVGLTQPDDADALRAVLDEQEVVFRDVGGWTAFAESQAALDRLGGEGDTLAGAERFTEAWAELPDEALARVYFDGRAAEHATEKLGATVPGGTRFEAAVFSLEAEENGIRVGGTALGQEQALPDLTFAEEVPAGAILFVNFHGSQGGATGLEQLRDNPFLGDALEQVEATLGVTVEDVAKLFEGEGALYVRPGVLIPEVTIVLEAGDEAAARQTLDRLGQGVGRLLGGGGATSPRSIGGVEVTELNLGQLSLYYGVFDGRAVVTTLPSGIEDLREDGDRLADDGAFEDAKEAAGEGDVALYLDIDETVGLAERLLQLAQQPVPEDVRGNLAPLRSFVVVAEGGDGKTSLDAFLSLD